MRSSRTLCRLSVLAAGMLVSNAWAQPTLAAGNWQAQLGPAGPEEIRWRDGIVARRGAFAGYLPEWKGTRFSMAEATMAVAGAAATWTKAVPGNQEATLILALTPERVELTLRTTVAAAGPSEFSLQIAPEAVQTDATRCFGWLNGAGFAVALDGPAPFEKIPGVQEMRFEQPGRTVTLRCDGFEIQDRRAGGGGLFLVQVIGSSGTEARIVERRISLEIDEAPPESVATRGILLAQRLVDRGSVDVPNPGFDAEPPLQGWSGNPNAAADPEVSRSAPHSVRLHLDGTEADDNPYVTRLVPVSPGSLYQAEAWIRTRDVTPASKRGMAATGATVILEFATAAGKWHASGSYAKGLYGTREWTRVATSPVRAPEGSGQAIIFLSLRANGTAWFDDVKLATVQYHTMLLQPLPGSTVADNTPRFVWRTELPGSGVVHLSPDPAFPPERTMEIPAGDAQWAEQRTPLATGTWHWRVAIPGIEHTSHAFHFEQTAPLDQDCTPPLITGEHGWLERADQPVAVTMVDNAPLDSARIDAEVNGQAVQVRRGAATRTDAGEHALAVDVLAAAHWQAGLNRVRLTVVDAAGNAAEETVFRTWTPEQPKTVWTTHHGIATGDRRRFLFGMYGILPEDIPTMAAAGFDVVHNYSWDGAGTVASALAYLDQVHAHGMQAFMGLDRRRLQAGDESFVAERVAALMAHPGLLCWYLYDEPDLLHQYVSPAWMARFYRLIKALDPFHPVVVTCAADAPVGQYKDSYDVHWTQVYGTTAHVAARIPKHRALMHPEWPLAAILHCYDRAQTGLLEAGIAFDPDKFQPDARVLRANAFMALTKQSSGLLWWWWGQGSSRYPTVARVPWAWEALKRTVADIRSLEPILVADGTEHTWIETPAAGVEVHFREKRTADRTLIIAVNRDDTPCRVAFRPRTVRAGTRLEVVFEDRHMTVAGGEVADAFDGLGVRVYQARHAAGGD